MASLARWTEADIRGLTTPITVLATAQDCQIAARRRAIAQETTDLFEMARRQAVLRWRGLTPDHRAS